MHRDRVLSLSFALVLFAIVLGGFMMTRFSASTDQPETRPPPANTSTPIGAAVDTAANCVNIQPMVGGGSTALRWPDELAIVIDIAPKNNLSNIGIETARTTRQWQSHDNTVAIFFGRFAGDASKIAFIHRPLLASSGRFAARV